MGPTWTLDFLRLSTSQSFSLSLFSPVHGSYLSSSKHTHTLSLSPLSSCKIQPLSPYAWKEKEKGNTRHFRVKTRVSLTLFSRELLLGSSSCSQRIAVASGKWVTFHYSKSCFSDKREVGFLLQSRKRSLDVFSKLFVIWQFRQIRHGFVRWLDFFFSFFQSN